MGSAKISPDGIGAEGIGSTVVTGDVESIKVVGTGMVFDRRGHDVALPEVSRLLVKFAVSVRQ
ncbi:hypothetical protein CH063_12237, partial [Colletotrichum higginsianum]